MKGVEFRDALFFVSFIFTNYMSILFLANQLTSSFNRFILFTLFLFAFFLGNRVHYLLSKINYNDNVCRRCGSAFRPPIEQYIWSCVSIGCSNNRCNNYSFYYSKGKKWWIQW